MTGDLQRRAWDEGVLPPVERVRPGLWSIPVPIPQNPLRYVLVYAFELPDGVALVDAGWNTDDAWAALEGGLGRMGCGPQDVRWVLVTHIHPDHYGLAGRLQETSGARVCLHPADAALLTDRYGAPVRLLDRQREMLADCGVPSDLLDPLTGSAMPVIDLVEPATPDVFIEDGDRLALAGWDLSAIWTPGHSPGHLCFYEANHRLLLSGDHVLPRITPNISVHHQQRENPLAEFLDSLATVAGFEVEEVLPAHEWRFRPLAARTAALAAHHAERLAEIEALAAAAPGSTAYELTVQLRWSRPWNELSWFMRRVAVGETLAHLVLLRHQGHLHDEPGPPRRWYPSRSGPAPQQCEVRRRTPE